MADNSAVQRENIPLRAAGNEIRKKKGLDFTAETYEEVVKSLSPETQAKLARTLPPSSHQPQYGAGEKAEYNPRTETPGNYLEGDRYLRSRQEIGQRGNRFGERIKRLFGRE